MFKRKSIEERAKNLIKDFPTPEQYVTKVNLKQEEGLKLTYRVLNFIKAFKKAVLKGEKIFRFDVLYLKDNELNFLETLLKSVGFTFNVSFAYRQVQIYVL